MLSLPYNIVKVIDIPLKEHDSSSTGNSPRNADRPVTPINDSIKSAPKTYAGLSKLIHRRIHPRAEWEHISLEDQSSLV